MVPLDDRYLTELRHRLQKPKIRSELLETIVNAPFHDQLMTAQFGLGIIVLLLVNPDTQTVDRVALSETEGAVGAVRMSSKPFHDIKIPLSDPENLIARAITTGQPQEAVDWQGLFVPILSAKDARLNQAGAGVEYSAVYPLPGKTAGALIFSYHEPPEGVGEAERSFMQTYAALAADCLHDRPLA